MNLVTAARRDAAAALLIAAAAPCAEDATAATSRCRHATAGDQPHPQNPAPALRALPMELERRWHPMPATP